MRTSQRRTRPRNQRISNQRQRRQQHLLDVKVRSRSATQHRNRRIIVWLSKTALVIALAVGVYFVVREGARRFFFENPDYQLKTIAVQTDGAVQRDQIFKVADLLEEQTESHVKLGEPLQRI